MKRERQGNGTSCPGLNDDLQDAAMYGGCTRPNRWELGKKDVEEGKMGSTRMGCNRSCTWRGSIWGLLGAVGIEKEQG